MKIAVGISCIADAKQLPTQLGLINFEEIEQYPL